MPPSLEEAISELESLKQPHLDKGMAMLRAFGGAGYPADFLCAASINRSLSHIDGFLQLIRAKNFICAAALVRMQLDTLFRFRAMWLVTKPHDFAMDVLAGKPINKLKDRRGKPMKDWYLVESLESECTWAKSVYEQTCGYIHLSEKHFHHVMRADPSRDGVINLSIGGTDSFVTDEHRLEAVLAFIDITKCLLKYIDEWIFTKSNPKEVEKLKRVAP